MVSFLVIFIFRHYVISSLSQKHVVCSHLVESVKNTKDLPGFKDIKWSYCTKKIIPKELFAENCAYLSMMCSVSPSI